MVATCEFDSGDRDGLCAHVENAPARPAAAAGVFGLLKGILTGLGSLLRRLF